MERYFYHGIEPYHGFYGYSINVMINVLQSEGLRTRNNVRSYRNERYEHVCLYRKNEEYDYTEENVVLKSARSCWIDRCFVFITSPDILAEKVKQSTTTGFDENNNPITDLVDEWRSIGSISNTKIEGIALPFDTINEYLNEDIGDDDKDTLEYKKQLIELLPKLKSLAESMGIFIVNSDEKDFTDKLDEVKMKVLKKIKEEKIEE